jgi:Na+-translocating ferredoxin:NAD+ oxidoreductase RnfE subunit
VTVVTAVGHGISPSSPGRWPSMGMFLKAIVRACDVIDRSVAISSYEQIYDSTIIMAQHRPHIWNATINSF